MIAELLKEHFEIVKKDAFEHTDRLYPSHSSAYVDHTTYKRLEGRCLRSAYYSCTGVQEDIELTVQKNLLFKIGDYTELMILDLLERKGILKDKGVKFEIPKYKIAGKLDGIIELNGKLVGLEIKSIGSNKYSNSQIFGSPWNPPTPKWQNLFQTLIYCYAFRATIDEFILFYIRRDTCEIKEFKVSICPEGDKIYPVINGQIDRRYNMNDILLRYKVLIEFLEKKELPPREFMKIYPAKEIAIYKKLGIISQRQLELYKIEPFGDYECKFCGYSKLCDANIV